MKKKNVILAFMLVIPNVTPMTRTLLMVENTKRTQCKIQPFKPWVTTSAAQDLLTPDQPHKLLLIHGSGSPAVP